MIIVDSTVLIALGNIGRIDLLPKCIIPEKVLEEITKEPTKSAIRKFRIFTPSENSRRKALEILGDEEETGIQTLLQLCSILAAQLQLTTEGSETFAELWVGE